MLRCQKTSKYLCTLFGVDDAAAGAIIAGGTALLGTGASIAANTNLNNKNRKWQTAEAKKARDWQERMYNQYNTPSAQLQQMQSAGLNPYATSQSSTTPMSMSTSIPSVPSGSAGDFSSIARAGETIANSLHARSAQKKQLEFQQKQLDQVALDSFRQYMLDLASGFRDQKELDMQLKALEASIESYNASTEAQKLMNDMLKDFINSGGNTYEDTSNETNARIDKIYADIANGNLASSDAHKLAQLNYKIAHDTSEHTIKMLSNESLTSSSIATLNNSLGIDYNALPDYLKVAAMSYLGIVDKVANGDPSIREVQEYNNVKAAFAALIDEWQTSSKNASNPNYQSNLQQSQFMLDYWKTATGFLKLF